MEEAKPAPKPAGGPTCPSCGTVNTAGMNFCKMCGTSLVAPAAAPAAAAAPSDKVTCPSCQKQTPSGFAFCQHCGHRLGAPSGPVVAADKKVAVAATMMAEAPILPTPPAGMPRAASGTLPASRPSSDALAATVAPSTSALAAAVSAESPRSGSAGMSTVRTTPVSSTEEKVYATLVVVRRDGSDGDSVRVTAPTFDIGRSEGGLTFAEDIYLSPRHLRLTFEGGRAIARVLDAVNGVYLRLRGPVELHPGDQFLVGKEVLRFEPVGAEEREVTVHEHGVRLFGTVPREGWGRLRQITAAGTTRDVWHMARPDLVLGREEGDITFPDDEFMSRRHAAVRRASPRPRLEDLNSSNGTFLRLRGEHTLSSGDLLRLGDQLLRVEI